MKREPQIDKLIRHLANAYDIARKGRMPFDVRRTIGTAQCAAWCYRDLAARRKRKGKS